MMTLPVPPIEAEHARFYGEVVECLRLLAVPQGPTTLWPCAQDRLPPAARHINKAALVSDLGVLAVSNGAAWIRQDTGAAL